LNQKQFFDVLDFIVLDFFFAWNMSSEEVQGRLKERMREYYAVKNEELIVYVDETGGDDI